MNLCCTDRLMMCSNLMIDNRGHLICPHQVIPANQEEGGNPNWEDQGFVFYDRRGRQTPICHIAFTKENRPYEIVYETALEYRRNGFMREAMHAFITWIFSNTYVHTLNALINDNDTAKKILLENSFHLVVSDWRGEWYALNKLEGLNPFHQIGDRQ